MSKRLDDLMGAPDLRRGPPPIGPATNGDMVQAAMDGPFREPDDDDECDCERADCPICTARARAADVAQIEELAIAGKDGAE